MIGIGSASISFTFLCPLNRGAPRSSFCPGGLFCNFPFCDTSFGGLPKRCFVARKRNRRWVSVGFSLGLSVSACNSRQEETQPLPHAAQVPSPKKEEAPKVNLEAISNAAQYAIAPYAVDKQQFAKQVLYTWTTKEQIEELRARPILLTRSESPQFGSSGFDQRVAAERGANDEMTELLKRPQLSMRRFAWVTPWATMMGFQGESYGSQLIKITLKEDALIASYTPRDNIHWDLADLKNQRVALETLQDHPERLAAIYYEAEGKEGKLSYREYVLCNESMIETWEYATSALLNELTQEEKALRQLIEWAKVAPNANEVARFFDATRAFPVRPYTSEVADLEALADLLLVQKGSQGEALTSKPALTFDELGAVVKPVSATPLVAPLCYDSFCPPPKPKSKPKKAKPHLGTF
jgi:hypothetical protein